MTKLPTLILPPRYTEDSQLLWQAANQLGWQTERLQYWKEYLEPSEHLFHIEDLVFYVDVLFAPEFANILGKYLLEPPEDWLVKLPYKYKLRYISLMTLKEAKQLTELKFIKPPNDKSFPARVWKGNQLPTDFDENMPVLVSDIVKFEKEFRCYILNRQLKTFSIYLRNGELQKTNNYEHTLEEEKELLHFVNDLLNDNDVVLGKTAVLDVGTINGQWAVVEQNAAWGSGIYGCDPKSVLEVIKHSSTNLGFF
jgi:hypothetical protein